MVSMACKFHVLTMIILLALMAPCRVTAQSDDSDQSLGDLARSLRKSKAAPATPTVIDNDNLSQVMDEVQNRRIGGTMLFSIDEAAKKLKVSSPDVTCSLSFSAQATSLLSDPFVPQDLPANELVKLEGPATITGDTLQVSIHNGSRWEIREITVGLTILRHAEANSAYYGVARVIPAAQITNLAPEKHADLTVLYHLKGSAAPSSTSVFRETLSTTLALDQDWHWAIVQAKGVPPKPVGN
jgi:hypothetical protein